MTHERLELESHQTPEFPPALITWVAVNNDPYEREGKNREYRLVDGKAVPGPTLTLLSDPDSPFAGQIRDVVLLHRVPSGQDADREESAVRETAATIPRCCEGTTVHLEGWPGEDPTDHRSIFEFLRRKVPDLRRRFAERDLIIHISPGTPSMHTIWVLMAETGFIDPPFKLVKSYRKAERYGRPAVVPVEVGIETFYKYYKSSRPRQISSEDQGVVWDPARFQTERMRAVYAEARRFALTNVPILIRGERGTGKTTLASWIRTNSPFMREGQNDRWPSVACGQYNAETMRAELFGYRKGSFTGATTDKKGLLAAADGDTLFLDEVGDVSRDLQRLLIRALEEKTYFALGDDKPRRSNFRLITATNIDDLELQHRLDPDFLDRISIFTLDLPPLREVRGELPWLWEAVYLRASERAGVSKIRTTIGSVHHKAVVSYLSRHSLPGNIRDLFRVAYRILASRNDPEDSLSPAEAVEYGIRGLAEAGSSKFNTQIRSVAVAFANAATLGDVLDATGVLDTGSVVRALKAFLAQELRRLAKERGVRHEELCDVSERTLRGWVQDFESSRNDSSAGRHNTAGQ